MLIDFSALSPEERQALFNGPALAPPAGIIPNLDDPPNNNTAGHIILAICIIVSTTFVLIRSYANFVIFRPNMADYLMLIAYGLYMSLMGLVYTLMGNTGIFVHQWDVRLGETPDYLKITFHCATIFSTLVGVLKSAILVDWLRIFVPPGTRNFMFWACHFFLWVNVAWAICMVITNVIACVPYEYNYNKLIAGSCNIVDQSKTNLAASIFNFLMDVLVFFLPQRVIWRLKISKKKKLGVSMVFMIGLAAIVATGVRLGLTVVNVSSEDYTYTFSSVMMCALGEGLCGFIILCGIAVPRVTSSLKESKWVSSLRSWTHPTSKRTQATREDGNYTPQKFQRREYSTIEDRKDIYLQPLRTTITPKPERASHHHAMNETSEV